MACLNSSWRRQYLFWDANFSNFSGTFCLFRSFVFCFIKQLASLQLFWSENRQNPSHPRDFSAVWRFSIFGRALSISHINYWELPLIDYWSIHRLNDPSHRPSTQILPSNRSIWSGSADPDPGGKTPKVQNAIFWRVKPIAPRFFRIGFRFERISGRSA